MYNQDKMKKYNVSGFEVFEYEEVESTNTLAESFAVSELKDKQVLLTYHQTQGRGQLGNKWESETGQNISMTIVFKPAQLEAGKQFAVSMVIALGCFDFVCRYVDGCSVKWPNDIYVNDRKIAGILIEHRIGGMYIQNSLCGIGLNINQEVFRSDAPNPVSLLQLTGKKIPLKTALAELLECIGKRYVQVGEYELLEAGFMQHIYRAQGIFDWEDENGKFRASVDGVDEYGRLILKDSEDKERVYGFKEVKYI